jgi:hypothetical protein
VRKVCNFYSLHFKQNEYIPYIRKGIKIKVEDNIAYLDGVCSYKILVETPYREYKNVDLDKLFIIYPDKTPWIAKEGENEFYLYKGSIDSDSLNLSFNIEPETIYLSVELSNLGDVSINRGRVISRVFNEDKQTCIVELKKDTNIIIEQGEKLAILEWNGEKFICR